MEKDYKPVYLYFEHYVPTKCDPSLHPIIFVHGLVESSETWNTIMQRISEETRRQAYAVDLRNHGKSEWRDSLNTDSVCRDIENFMAKRGIEKSVFVTHSFGGRVCMSISLRKPELVEKIVVEDARLSDVTVTQLDVLSRLVELLRWINVLSKTMTEKELRSLMAKRAKQIYPENPDIEMAVYCLPGQQDKDGTFRLAFNAKALERSIKDGSIINIDLTGCQAYTGPALFIYGTKSDMEVGKDELIPQYFPNAEFSSFENVGHYIHKESTEKFVSEVCKFINN